jgi:hypothetical protein
MRRMLHHRLGSLLKGEVDLGICSCLRCVVQRLVPAHGGMLLHEALVLCKSCLQGGLLLVEVAFNGLVSVDFLLGLLL